MLRTVLRIVRHVLCVSALVWSVTSSALAQESPATVLERARELILHARYADAVPQLELLLARRDLRASERNQVLEMIAIAHVANRDEPQADRTLDVLYRRDPEHRLSDRDQGPVVEAAFERARARAHERVAVEIEHSQPSGSSARIAVEIVEGADAVEDLRVAFRASDVEAPYTRLEMTRASPERAEAQLPIPEDSGGSAELEYYIEALAPSGASLARVGDAESPLAISITRPQSAPDLALRGIEEDHADRPTRVEPTSGGLLGEWWFWTAVGAVVIGGGVTSYVLLNQGPEDGSLGGGALE